MRWAIKNASPLTIGINWYSKFDDPVQDSVGNWWMIDPSDSDFGWIRGGHCTVLYGASDSKQAFKMKNS